MKKESCKGLPGCHENYISIKKKENRPFKRPNFLQKVWNFIVAIADHVWNGSPELSDSEYKQRIDVCIKCIYFKRNTCNLCGCYMPVKGRWRRQKCPDNRWSI